MWDTYNKGLTKGQEKLVRSLKQKKYREENALFVAEGIKLAMELISSENGLVKKIFGTEKFYTENTFFPDHAECYVISEKELKKISSLSAPNDVLVCVAIPSSELDIGLLQGKLSIVLDDIHDPGNLGTIIRIADWFGIDHIICSLETVDAYNPKVVQASMGSIARVKLFYRELEGFLSEYKREDSGEVYGAIVSGENVYESRLLGVGLLVIGNESRGISKGIAGLLDKKISIPGFRGTSGPESLNAANAAAILCSEFRRRKKE